MSGVFLRPHLSPFKVCEGYCDLKNRDEHFFLTNLFTSRLVGEDEEVLGSAVLGQFKSYSSPVSVLRSVV